MDGWKTSRKGWGKLLPPAAAAAALAAFSAGAAARMSEIDAFQNAVTTQSRQEALAFVDEFGSSHLIPDLIELLRPEVASQVCARLGRGSARTRASCDRMERALATALALADPATAPATAATNAAAATAPAVSTAPAVKPMLATTAASGATRLPIPPAKPKAAASAAATPAASPDAPAPSPAKAKVVAPAAATTAAASEARLPMPPAKPKAAAATAPVPPAPAPTSTAPPVSPAFMILPGPEFQMVKDPVPATPALGKSTAGPVRPPEDGLSVASTAPSGDLERRHR